MLDAFALIAYLRGEPAAPTVRVTLQAGAVASTVQVVEVVDQLVRVFGWPADDLAADLALMRLSGLDLLPLGAGAAYQAGRLRARHYSRTSRSVSLADCTAAELALRRRDELATPDPHLADLVRDEGGRVLALPDSSGRLP